MIEFAFKGMTFTYQEIVELNNLRRLYDLQEFITENYDVDLDKALDVARDVLNDIDEDSEFNEEYNNCEQYYIKKRLGLGD